MKNLKYLFVLLATTLFIAGCKVSSKVEDTNTTNNLPQLRAVHLSPDAPAVDVSVNGQVVLQDVMYRQASGFLRVGTGHNNIKVLAANSNNAVIDATLDLIVDTKYTVIASDVLAKIAPIVIVDSVGKPTAGFAGLTVVHGAASAPSVDIYLSAPDANFPYIPATLQGVSFTENSGELEVASGNYRVRVTAAGNKDVLYDSGTLALADGVEYIVIAADNNDAGAAPIGLTILTDLPSTPFINVKDVRSRFRVVHASADAPNVDVLVDNSLLPSLTNVPFGVGSAYLNVPPNTYNVKVAATGSKAPVIEANLLLETGVDYTIAAINPLASIKPLVLVDDNSAPAVGSAKLRLVHASPSAGLVDIYLTAPGVDISNTSFNPNISNVAFEANTGYLELAAGNYQVRIALAGTKTVAIDTGTLALASGQIRTAFAVDPAPGSAAFGVILLPDAN